MFQKNKRISLLSYWTSRYVLSLIIGLLFVSLISALWIRHTTLENRLEIMQFMADETVNRMTDIPATKEELPNKDFKDRKGFNFRDIEPIMFITDTQGTVISVTPPINLNSSVDFLPFIKSTDNVYKVEQPEADETYYTVKSAIEVNEEIIGYVFLMESKDQLTKVKQEYGQLAIFLITLGILGWVAIYFLSKRLSRPIMNVAAAAKQVQEGNYDVNLPSSIKEKEVYDLVTSFKEMASRLEQLEKTRTELLAGVTHELKTPVTSISGLLQAAKDGVVTGDEADEFIKMALIETTKMKTMVGDLLSFNSFAVDAVQVKVDSYEVNHLIEEIVTQWNVTHKNEHLEVAIQLLDQEVTISADFVRIQQIVTNLLTNALQAMPNGGEITVSLSELGSIVDVQIQDTGFGIRLEDQPYIFERFFRGENKKYAVRGLGLGLPLSKMMAQSIGGDLVLKNSNKNGTTFNLRLKKQTN